MMEPGIIVHSGAGYFPDTKNAAKLEVTKAAALAGWIALCSGDKSPMDAVESAIKLMENNEECNAGYGSVLNAAGDVEMDAMIIRGKDLGTGGVGALRKIQHPISVSRRVLEVTDHCLLVGEGALEFATSQGFPIVPNESLVSPRAKAMLAAVLTKTVAPSTETGCGGESIEEEGKEVGLGTVGAVAINELGELVAGTSTGGISGKFVGRVGDTPIPGGGTLCDDRVGGVSGTGKGEAIMRVCLASRIATLLGQQVETSVAILTALEEMEAKVGSDGGAIAIRQDGLMGHAHTSRKMTWASVQGGQLRYGLTAGEEFVVPLPEDLFTLPLSTQL